MILFVVKALDDDGKLPAIDLDDIARGGEIRCPKCAWRPRAGDRWQCDCGCLWNTFDTRGRCPDCNYQWEETACLACGEWSLHEDWYAR
jgi:hypothetical protein